MKERWIKPTLEITATLAALWAVSSFAFSVGTRKRIGARDGWTCQWEDGCTLGKDGGPAKFSDGFMVDAAHHDHDYSQEWYDFEDNGRILCLAHHYLDELAKGHFEVLPLLGSRDPYTTHVRRDKKKYPWLNGYKTVNDVIREIGSQQESQDHQLVLWE